MKLWRNENFCRLSESTIFSDTHAFTSFFEFSTACDRLLPVVGTGDNDLSECTRFRCEKQFPELATTKGNKSNLLNDIPGDYFFFEWNLFSFKQVSWCSNGNLHAFGQYGHRYGFSPVCWFVWNFKSWLRLNVAQQILHLCGRKLLCEISCCFSVLFDG